MQVEAARVGLLPSSTLVDSSDRERAMLLDYWYLWVFIGWVVCGLLAFAMDFRDKPALRENIGWAEFWPVILGPLWLTAKVWEWATRRGMD